MRQYRHFKDTSAYEIIEILYLGFSAVLDGKKSWRPAVLTDLKKVSIKEAYM